MGGVLSTNDNMIGEKYEDIHYIINEGPMDQMHEERC